MDPDRFFELAADATRSEPKRDPAPARLKARVYSRLVAAHAATGPLLSLSRSRESGRALCVFESLVAHAPLPDSIQSMNPCTVCHARHLAERLERAPIYWPNCPYAGFHRR